MPLETNRSEAAFQQSKVAVHCVFSGIVQANEALIYPEHATRRGTDAGETRRCLSIVWQVANRNVRLLSSANPPHRRISLETEASNGNLNSQLARNAIPVVYNSWEFHFHSAATLSIALYKSSSFHFIKTNTFCFKYY